MAEPICEDEGLLQEWTPLTQLLQQIPLKSQRGIFSQNLNLTCLDVVSEFIALGTNSGFVYWYCRATADLQKLRFENSNCSVTCIKIMAFSDYMVAAGTDQGTLIVFQIPKIKPDCTPDQIKFKQKQIERFTINSLHKSPVTSIEWDPYETKVFSGDKLGYVVLTEINLNLHISKSMEILNEKFEIVQLNFNQLILLVSSVYRSIICDASNNWKVRQVGTKERKILGKFGATLCKFQHGLMLYASRPGHRLWLSDHNGIVQQTLIFKSAIQSNCPKIQLINPVVKNIPYDTSFGKLVQFGDSKLITYNNEILYVLHPGAVSVVSVLNSARKILDLAVNENEIFILEGERSLLRISPLPDRYSLDLLYQPVSRRTSFNFDEFAAKIKDSAVESIKKITKDLIPTNDETSPNSPPALADEAVELPLIVNLPPGIMPAILTGENFEIHSSILDENYMTLPKNLPNTYRNSFEKCIPFETKGSDNFSLFNYDWQEEVVSRPLRKRHNKKSKQDLQCSTLVSESESDTTNNVCEDRLVCGVVNDLSLSDDSAYSHSQSSFSVLRDISSLLAQEKTLGNEDVKTYDTKSQASLDTCESVSENLLLTSEAFREKQEKTFARLANHSLIDSFNSEKTDNMSISFNITTSSSFSSKISENLPSASYTSENSEMASRTKSAESENTDNIGNEMQPLSKNCWNWDNNLVEEISNQEDHGKASSESSGSNFNSQREPQLYPKWANEDEAGSSNDFPDNGFNNIQKADYPESDCSETGFPQRVFTNGAPGGRNKISDCANEAGGNDCELNSPEFADQKNDHFLQSGTNKIEEEERRENDFDAKTFLLNESLSYGPPSGSSLLGSQPSSDFSSMTVLKALVRDSTDHWPEYKTPTKILSLDVCRNYVICTDVNDNVYYSSLSGLGLSWKLLDYKASKVRVAKDGCAVWFLRKKNMYALVNPPLSNPISDDIVEIAQDIKTFAVDSLNNKLLMVTFTGKIKLFTGVKKCLHEKEIVCDYIVADVACSGEMILAISNEYTVLLKFPEEEEFKVIKTLKPVISIAMGPENLLWVVDKANNIFFSDDFISDEPHWWQIQLSDYIFQNSSGSFQNIRNKIKFNKLKANIILKSSLIAVNENSVWIFNKFDSSVYVNNTGFTGYMWSQISPSRLFPHIQWRILCTGGEAEEKERIWLLALDGNIFLTTASYQSFQSIPAPCEENICCMTSYADTLWVLSESGRIYSRLGLGSRNMSGISWKEIKLPQIDNLKFIWISCGCDVAWACDIHGRTFITMKSSHDMNILDPNWFEVEGRPRNVKFEKVFVGSPMYMVWAIDTNHYLYIREGIFPHYQIGTNWVYVCGIEVAHLSISESHVLALAVNGNIYRRCGVSESNPIGDYWRKIPGCLKILSSSFIDNPLGISHENKILRLNYNLKILQEEKFNTENEEALSLRKDISWEIVK